MSYNIIPSNFGPSGPSFPNLNQIYAQLAKAMTDLRENVDEVFIELDKYIKETNKVFDKKQAQVAQDKLVELKKDLAKINQQLMQLTFVNKDVKGKLLGIEQAIANLEKLVARGLAA